MPKLINRIVPLVSPIVIFCLVFIQVAGLMPRAALAEVSAELKEIEYKYYFRGKYEEAITALQAMLEARELELSEQREAREFLAASLILTGSAQAGKDQFLKILNQDGTYAGPDAGVFQPNIIAVYKEAKVEYASLVIQQAGEIQSASDPAETESAVAYPTEGKPIYKKWWFYTAIGVVVLVAAAAAAQEEEVPENWETGTVSVGVAVQ
jgi:hypothetical protein